MGWSCTKEASNTLSIISEWCIQTTGFSNVFNPFNIKDVSYFFEIGDTEYEDGRIAGEVWNMNGYQVGAFRINPDGRITTFAGLPEQITLNDQTIDVFQSARMYPISY